MASPGVSFDFQPIITRASPVANIFAAVVSPAPYADDKVTKDNGHTEKVLAGGERGDKVMKATAGFCQLANLVTNYGASGMSRGR
jgi:hypothetical protein